MNIKTVVKVINANEIKRHFSNNDNVRCVGTRPVGSTMVFPLVTAVEDSSSGVFGGWRPGESRNIAGGWGLCLQDSCHVS